MKERGVEIVRGSRQDSRKPSWRNYFREPYDPFTSLVLTLPVFALYHLGVLSSGFRNGVDLVSSLLFEAVDGNRWAYAGMVLGFSGALVGAMHVLRKRGALRPAAWAPMLIESAILAWTMAFCAGYAVQTVFQGQTGPALTGGWDRVVMSAGAGFHEEMVFRIGLFRGGVAAARRWAHAQGFRWIAGIAFGSALLFSLAHYVGPYGDELRLTSVVFRVLIGLFLSAVVWFRGLAVAVYTHFFYDLLFFFVWSD